MTDKIDMIYDLVQKVDKKSDKIIECNTRIKVKQENHEQRLTQTEKHIADEDKHYNPYYSETSWEKIKRKRGEITFSIGGGSILAVVVVLVKEMVI